MNQDAFPSGLSPIVVPDLGTAAEPIRFVTGLVLPGARVIPGERIAELLAEGIVFQLDAEIEGKFENWTLVPGSNVRTGDVIGYIRAD